MITFDGVLFFPVTPFDADDRVELGLLRDHVEERLEFSPGGVFPACGTGEFSSLDADEVAAVVAETVRVVRGRVPVVAGTGGQLAHARSSARSAEAAGADALLLLPPYLLGGPAAGTVAYVEAVAEASGLPIIVYHRGTAQYTAETMVRLAENPKVVGFKDGTGDVALAQDIVSAVAATGREDFQFFNGLLTAELSQAAYRGLGIPLYSSAVFAMAPRIAAAHYYAYTTGNEEARTRLLQEFYFPLARLRDRVPGFGVSLVKAGVRLGGLPVGSVRPPLVDPAPEHLAELEALLARGHDLL
ncbi:5-dehydro-4-deoxyglucarate dehydratase [soil metagenome]